jgi:nitroreductase
MPQTELETLGHIIKSRHTVKPVLMNGRSIPDEKIEQILALADYAPNHGRTEPWRFFVYGGDQRLKFGQAHADMYRDFTPEAEFEQKKYDALKNNPSHASHIVMVTMKRGTNPKIPAIEEYAATSAAIENVLLGAAALGIAGMWNTGGMTHYPPMKNFLGIGEEDEVLALLYLGYTDEQIPPVPRKVSMAEKVKWIKD